MKRILYIESAPQAGGSTVSLYEFLRRIDRSRYEPIVLLCPSNPYRRRFEEAGVRVLSSPAYCSVRTPLYPPGLARARAGGMAARLRGSRLGRPLWRAAGLATRSVLHTWPLARSVQQVLRAERIDLLHLNDAPELHKAGILAARLAGVPCICHVRSLPPLDWLDRRLARFVTMFVFISKAVEQDQRSKGLGQRPGKVVYNALDLSAYANTDQQAARRALQVDGAGPVIGMMGRVEPWKGQRELLAAVATLAPRFPALRCLIAGAPELDGAWFLDELTASVRALGLEGVVRFCGYQNNPPQFLAALDVLVHASTQPEPFGRVLIEGMAAGLPVVATNAGGVPEIVPDGEAGLLVPPTDTAALAVAIERLLADPAARREMGACGRRLAATFAIEGHVKAIQDIYRGILKE